METLQQLLDMLLLDITAVPWKHLIVDKTLQPLQGYGQKRERETCYIRDQKWLNVSHEWGFKLELHTDSFSLSVFHTKNEKKNEWQTVVCSDMTSHTNTKTPQTNTESITSICCQYAT